MWDGDARHNAGGAYGLGNGGDGANLYCRYTHTFNLFYNRCSATCAGASGAGHNDCIHFILA